MIVGAALLLVGLAVTPVATMALVGRGPTLADAQRECRTAFNAEFAARETRAETASYASSVMSSVTDVQIQEARETEAGFEVNGVVRYDLTTALLPTVHSSLNLTCEAREQDGKLVTTVKNRR